MYYSRAEVVCRIGLRFVTLFLSRGKPQVLQSINSSVYTRPSSTRLLHLSHFLHFYIHFNFIYLCIIGIYSTDIFNIYNVRYFHDIYIHALILYTLVIIWILIIFNSNKFVTFRIMTTWNCYEHKSICVTKKIRNNIINYYL